MGFFCFNNRGFNADRIDSWYLDDSQPDNPVVHVYFQHQDCVDTLRGEDARGFLWVMREDYVNLSNPVERERGEKAKREYADALDTLRTQINTLRALNHIMMERAARAADAETGMGQQTQQGGSRPPA